jgi:hypothetical protein
MGVGYKSILQLSDINEVETLKIFFFGKKKKKLGDWF